MPGALVPFNRGKFKIVRRPSRKLPKVTPAEESYFNSALVIDMVREIAIEDFVDSERKIRYPEATRFLKLLDRFEPNESLSTLVDVVSISAENKKEKAESMTERQLLDCAEYMSARVRRLVYQGKISKIDHVTFLVALYDQKKLF